MTALTKAAFLVGLPLGAAWYFWHGHTIVAAALMAAAFAFMIGTKIAVTSAKARRRESTGAGEERRQIRRRAHRGPRSTANPTAAELPAQRSRIWKRCGRRLRESLNGSGAMRRYHLQAVTASCPA